MKKTLIVSLSICCLAIVCAYMYLTFANTRKSSSAHEREPAARFQPVSNVPSFTDPRDGKTYKTVKIGNQTWMAENLNYKTDGGSYCYGDDTANCAKYGRLYDWNTAVKACPAGWRLPASHEWQTLEDFAGGKTAGTKLKSKSGWDSNGNGSDDYGFSALPGGYRDSNGNFGNAASGGYWWSATDDNANDARDRYMGFNHSYVDEGWVGKNNGRSVRCLKD